MKIIPYEKKYLDSWLRCRLLASFNTAEKFNGLNPEKDEYPDNPMIDLICINERDEVIGLQQTVIDTKENKETNYNGRTDLGAYFMENFVHPDYQNQGIATKLFEQTCILAKVQKVKWLEIWTGSDAPANHFYQKFGARPMNCYWQVSGYAKPWPKSQCLYDENGFLTEVTREGQHFPYIQELTHYQVFQEANLQQIDAVQVNQVTCYVMELK